MLFRSGEISFTSYATSFYPYRFITKRLSFKSVYQLVQILLPLKYYSQKFFITIHLPVFAKLCRAILHPIDPRNIYFLSIEGKANDYVHGRLYNKTHDKKALFWYTVINTFDGITPTYEIGATHQQIEQWTKDAKFRDIKIWGKSGARVKAKR